MKRHYSADSAFTKNRTNFPQITSVLHNAHEPQNNGAPQVSLPQMRQQPAHNPFTLHTDADLPYFEQALNTAEVNQYILPSETSGKCTSSLAIVIQEAESKSTLQLQLPEKHTKPLLIIYDPQNPPAGLPWPWIADVVPKIEGHINDAKQAGAWLATCKRNYFANSSLREFRVFQKIKKELKEYSNQLKTNYKKNSQDECEFLVTQRFYEQITPYKNNFLTSPLTKEVLDALKLDLVTDKLHSSPTQISLINTFNETELLNGLRGLVRWHSAKFPPPVIYQIEQEKNIDKISDYHIDEMAYLDVIDLVSQSVNNPEIKIKALDTLIKAFLWGCSIENLCANGDGHVDNFSAYFIREKKFLSIFAIYRLGILTRSYQIRDDRSPHRLNEIAMESESEGLTLFDAILLESEEALVYFEIFKSIIISSTNEARLKILNELINELLELDEKNICEQVTNEPRIQSLIVEAALLAQIAYQHSNSVEAVGIMLKVAELIHQQLIYFSHLPENLESQTGDIKKYKCDNLIQLKIVINEIFNSENQVIYPTDPLEMLTIPTIQTQALGKHTLFQVDQEHFYHLICTFHQLTNYLSAMPDNVITQPLLDALNNIALSWPHEDQREVLLGWLPHRH